ncbi:hypothetical protein ABPG75_009036 [Micractinium tetrahymenae]
MAAFGSSDASSQGAALTAAGPGAAAGMEWDLDVDAFLDDYLKELGPEAQGPDHFGNIAIDFAPTTAQPGLLGAWGPSAPTASVPVDSAAHHAPTMLTGQLQAACLDSQQQQASGGAATQQAAATAATQQRQQQQQEASAPAAPATRSTRARKSAAGVAAASAAVAAAAAAAPSSGGTAAGRAASTGTSRGGRETKKEMDLKKHLALQEKNRRAQRRFRERQKQRVAELEEQVATLQAQLAAATAGNPAMVPAPVPVQAPAGSGAAVRLVPSDGDVMQHDGLKKEPHASPRAVVGEQVPSSGSPPGSDDEPVLPSVSFSDALTLTVREGHPVQLTARELADMTPAELAKYYKAYVNELAGILVESDNPASQATQERVRRLVDEVCLLSTRAALCNPPGSKHFALTKVDDVPGQPADARVPQIARALDITANQRKQLGQLRSLFLQKLGRIAGDRQEINAQLAGAVPGGTGNRHLCSRYLAAHDSARRLRESLREEHILVLDFISTIYKHVFTSQQVAQFMIQSYPWTPDCLALCTWVAAEDGDAEALSMLAADAQSKQQQAAAAAAASAAAPGGPQSSSGGSGASGNTLAAAPLGVPTPAVVASVGLPGAAGAPIFLPTAFAPAGMQAGAPAGMMFGQPMMVAAGAGGAPGMIAGFNPLMHTQHGSDPSGMSMAMMGQRWIPGGTPSVQSAGMHQPITAAGSGCLPVPLGLPHVAAAGSAGAPGAPSLDMGFACSPHVATMSSANADL